MTTKAQSIHAGMMLLEKLSTDKMLAAKIESAKSYSDFLKAALTEGYDLSGLSQREAVALAKGDRAPLGEISAAELEQIVEGRRRQMPTPTLCRGLWPLARSPAPTRCGLQLQLFPT